MATQSSPAFDMMPAPALATRRPLKRTAAYGETRFDERTRARPAPAVVVSTSTEPGFWDRVDELARSAAEASWTRTKALGRDALDSVKSWRKGAAPAPRARPVSTPELVHDAELLLLARAQLDDVRRAADGFARALVGLGATITDAVLAREAVATNTRARLIAHFGDELIDDVTHEPSARRVVEMHAKRAQMTPASLDDATRLVGADWERDADAGPGKLVVRSADGVWELAVDVAFATFRLRERYTGRFVDVLGAPVVTTDARDSFERTHFRFDA